jgi:dihydrodipicolinate synthase/N-acetylneuraminate lyase
MGSQITGPVFAIPTPFETRSGDVSLQAMSDFLDFLRAKHAHSIVVNGSTGEFSSLTMRERKTTWQAARKNFTGYVINNISATSWLEANALAHASDGADALLILPPYYFARASERGLIEFFRRALEGVEIPVYLYNFPRNVNIVLTPSLFAKIRAVCPAIVGVKDSSGDLPAAVALMQDGGAQGVFLGKDTLALAALRAGLAGSITGAGNPFPEFLVEIVDAWRGGDVARAEAAQAGFDVWNAFRATLPVDEAALVKAAIAMRLPGFPTSVRAPLIPLAAASRDALKAITTRLLADGLF